MAPLSNADIAIWHTAAINAEISSGTINQRAGLPCMMRLSPGDKLLGEGAYELFEFRALGDGTAQRLDEGNSVFFISPGQKGALSGAAAMIAGRAVANTALARKAAKDAVPRWLPLSSGTLYVTLRGAYFKETGTIASWGWSSIQSAELVGPHQLKIMADIGDGQQRNLLIKSDWAELYFVLWAWDQHPYHPQLVSRSWVTPGWEDRVRASGQPLPPGFNTPIPPVVRPGDSPLLGN